MTKNRFLGIPTTSITDALGSKNYMDISIKPLKQEWQLAGKAFTVDISAGENISVLEAISKAEAGDVLVIDGKSGTSNAFAGDFIIGLAKTKGLNGVVSNGVIRDIKGTKDLDFPVFCKGTTTAASKKNLIGKLNVPVNVGEVEVNPGDIIVADADGVAVIPKNNEEEVYQKTIERVKKDEERESRVGEDLEAVQDYLEKFLAEHKQG